MPANLPVKNAPEEVLAEVRRLGLAAPLEAAAIVRADRDCRQGARHFGVESRATLCSVLLTYGLEW